MVIDLYGTTIGAFVSFSGLADWAWATGRHHYPVITRRMRWQISASAAMWPFIGRSVAGDDGTGYGGGAEETGG